ncbi:S8 family peptidase [Flavobacterium sp. H122]|uniref:S8 family peptidase n=1 Tax=Flavobacterium sp. H122 TaxID=2529860 RepID=UPI00145A1E94|nr:S8 family peptidase [Flavobacterium sp. H122]
MQILLFLWLQIIYSQETNSYRQYVVKKSDVKSDYFICSYTTAKLNKYQIINRVDKNSCVVHTGTAVNKTEGLTGLDNKWKIHYLKKSGKTKNYTLHTLKNENIVKLLKQDKIQHTVKNQSCIIITCDYNYVKKLIDFEDVYNILEETQKSAPESKIRDQNFTVNNINKAIKNFSHLSGNNRKIGLKDNNINPKDIDLLNKVHFTNQGENSSVHGTDMATIMCGTGNSGIQGKGVANQASVQFSNVTDLYAEDSNPQNFQTQNHSYGTVIEEFYGSLAQSYDEKIHASKYSTHIFSVGNEGTKGFKTITGNFKQAKNILTIGAVNLTETITSFSSKGPAYDGRIKPELVAYSETGTSNATVIVSGLSVLLQEEFQNKNNRLLKNATLKAILINAAKDLGNKGPDYTYGFGNIDAYKSLQTINNNTVIESSVIQNEIKIFPITISEDTKKTKFTIVWDDLPAVPGSSLALINNLEITVTDENNNKFLPYTLNPNNPEQPATTGTEYLNNIKQIEIENLQPGNYTIEVTGKDIMENNQEFSIAYLTESKNLFEWNYPTANDNFPYDGKTYSPFKWYSNITNQTGELYISYDNGLNWQLINNTININTGQYAFIPENKICGIAKLKMKINNTEYTSPSFIISYDLNLNTTLACNNMTEMTWENNTKNGFKIYELADNEMKYKETVSQNYYTFTGYNIHTVTPVIDAFEGIKSESTLPTEPDSKCYFEYIRSETSNQNIQIEASLFSILNIEKIEIFKIEKNQKTILNAIETNFEKLFLINDLNPDIGENYYQIKITLHDGKTYESDIVNTFFMGQNNYLVYPTVFQSDSVNIITKDEQALPVSVQIYNTSGQMIKSRILSSVNDNIHLNDLQTGVYLYKLQSEIKKENKSTGKLVKL